MVIVHFFFLTFSCSHISFLCFSLFCYGKHSNYTALVCVFLCIHRTRINKHSPNANIGIAMSETTCDFCKCQHTGQLIGILSRNAYIKLIQTFKEMKHSPVSLRTQSIFHSFASQKSMIHLM